MDRLQAGRDYFKSNEFYWIMISTLLFIILAHGFLFSNEFFSHDSISYSRYWNGSFEYYIARGRFVTPFYELIKGRDLVSPWVVGILFCVWMLATNVFFIRFFNIASKPFIVITCGLLCTNIVICITGATYIFCLDEYVLSLFLSVLSAYFLCKSEQTIISKIVGILCLIMSLGIYQAYFTVTVFLCFVNVMQKAAENRKAREVIFTGVSHVLFMSVSLVIYYYIWELLCHVQDIDMMRVGESVLSSELGQLPSLIFNAIVSYGQFLWSSDSLLGVLPVVANVVFVAFLTIKLIAHLVSRSINLQNKIILVLLFILLPVTLNLSNILFPVSTDLTAYSRQLIYVLCILCTWSTPIQYKYKDVFKRYSKVVVAALLCVILWNNILLTNQAYIKKEVEKSATVSLVTRMLDKIESVEGYVPGKTEVCIIGELRYNTYFQRDRASVPMNSFPGIAYDYSATYNLQHYILRYLNYPLKYVTDKELIQNQEVKDMPVFPENGCVAMIDDRVVLKVSDI